MNVHTFQEVSGGDSGFTLLEILIAVIIFCIATFSSVMIFKGSIVRFERQSGEKKVFSEAIKVFDYMEKYLTSAMCNNMEGKLRINFEGEKEYVKFISPFSEGPDTDLAKFGIYFDREAKTVKVSVIRIDRNDPFFIFPSGFPGAQILGENIGYFQISYYDGKNWLDHWYTDCMIEPELPRIIKVEIKPFSQKIEGKRYEETFEKYIRISMQ
ncbi:MAG: prepilin-type N-terminal cleavage/methylation domain-containing protein [bacterium]|nr:prepilin-type N-terminal cleavage/methylation domain-containing protein [bacterium]